MIQETGRYSIITRLPLEEDLEALNAISIARQADATPGYPEYIARQIQRFHTDGVERKRMLLQRARSDPEHYFMREALVDNVPEGYATAEALPDDEFTWWRGIRVAKNSHSVGRALEADRRDWAEEIGRPVRVRIPSCNPRSRAFFGHPEQGFKLVAVEAPTSKRPFPFIVMEWRPPSLQSKTA